MDLTGALDPNIAALLGGGRGMDKFTQMLLQSINPGAAKDFQADVGPPNLGPLSALASMPPQTQTGQVAPGLPGPQAMQSLGFGMAAAAGKPGSSALSALGEGGTDMMHEGDAMADRSLREAQLENQAALEQWTGKGRMADEILGAQMKGPELEQKMMDLTGQSLQREEAAKDNAAYRAGLLTSAGAKNAVAETNAGTAQARAATGQQRADTYGERTAGQLGIDQQKLAIQQKALDARGEEFRQKLLQDAQTRGQRLGLDAAAKAALEFKNKMTLLKNPITGELPDEATQQALQSELAEKYQSAAGIEPAAAPGKKGGKVKVADAIAQANDAIAKGADPAAVRARLKGMGVDPAELDA